MSRSLSQTPISVLDLVPYAEGHTIADAFANTRDLAVHAESWGYKRYWMAEHHNLDGIASAATSVLIGHVAGATRTIRVGSGGIMLPNHAPLVIAEQFGTLAILFPNRIDLGLGRAPGTDPLTARALRKETRHRGDDFPELIEELQAYLDPAEPGQKLKAIPGAGTNVPIWILGSSTFSAQLAAATGRPYAFAGHFAPAAMLEALEIYRWQFRPSRFLEKPHAMVGVSVVAAATDDEAQFQATSLYQRLTTLVRGDLKPIPPPVRSMETRWTTKEEQAVRSMTTTLVVGGPDRVREGLRRLVDSTQADELIITSDLYRHEDRLKSFEIIAQAGRA